MICSVVLISAVQQSGSGIHTYGGGGLVTKSCLTLVTPWTVACQSPLSRRFPRQEDWSGLPFPSPGDLPDPGMEPSSPVLHVCLELYLKIPKNVC